MKLGESCLFKNSTALKNIEAALSVLVSEKINDGGVATFPTIYKKMRDEGIEVDAESLGTIYNKLYGSYDVAEISTVEEVDEFVGREYEAQIKQTTNAILDEQDTDKAQEIGKQSPEKSIALTIAKLFNDANYPKDSKIKSAMREMENIIKKAANARIEKGKKKAETLQDALQHFFNVESYKLGREDGSVNDLETLENAVKAEAKAYADRVEATLEPTEALIFRAQWDKFTDSLMSSAYDIVLSRQAQNQLVNESLKQIKVEGVSVVDINGNVKWSALIKLGDPDSIADKVAELYRNGVRDKDGNVSKYSPQQAQRIGNYFLGVYKDKLAKAAQSKIANNRTKNKSPKNIISDFLNDVGLFDVVKDKNGDLLLTKADWNTLLKKIKAEIGDRVPAADTPALKMLSEKLKKFLDKQVKADGSPKFTEDQKAIIMQDFSDTVTAKLQPATGDATDFERLIALNNVNNGNAFKEASQNALNKLLGVTDLQQSTLDQIQALAKAVSDIVNTSLVTNPQGVNRGAYAYQALSDIDRKIKELIFKAKLDSSGWELTGKYISDLMGSATASLLLNPNNGIENVTTGIFSNLAKSVELLFMNPKVALKAIGQSNKDFWVTWANYANGGSYSEIQNEAELENEIQSSERLRLRAAISLVEKQGVKGILKVLAQSPQFFVSVFGRVAMNSFDAAFNSAILRKTAVQSTYAAIKRQGDLSGGQSVNQIMDKIFNVDAQTNAEIQKEADRIFEIMKKAGLPVSATFKLQTRRDLRMSLYEDVMRDVAADKKGTVRQATEAAKLLISAGQTQSKTLTGKKKMQSRGTVSTFIYGKADWLLRPQKNKFEEAKKLEERGKMGAAARKKFTASLMQNTYGKFIGGASNFMALGLTATPLGFLDAWSLREQAKDLLDDGAGDVLKADPIKAQRYAEMHGMAKSIMARAIMGSAALSLFILSKLTDDEEEREDDGLANLLETKTGRRLAQKHFPMAIVIAASFIYKNNDGKKNQFDTIAEVTNAYTGKDFDAYNNFLTSLKYAFVDKEEGAVQEAVAKAVSGFLPTFNLNQAEQLQKFNDARATFFDPERISDVEENEKISKAMYKELDGVMDNILINGAINSFQRIISEEPYNRFKKD